MKKIWNLIVNWITGRNKYLAQIEKQEKLIDELSKRPEIYTFLRPVKPEESEQYAAFISQVWNDRLFKWFLNDIERAIIMKFKTGENADFCRGQLAIIEIMTQKMSEISDSYIINRKNGVDNE